MKLNKICQECGNKVTEKLREEFIEGLIAVTYSCDHVEFVSDLSQACKEDNLKELRFSDDTKPYPFQIENLRLILKSNFKAGIWDEMGLGKTVSSLLPFRYADLFPNDLNPSDLYPLAVLVKSGLKYQWSKEIWNKLGKYSQIINGKDEPLFDVFDIHIYSMDLLKNKKDLSNLPYKSVIIDECQLIKNPDSSRSKAVINFVSGKLTKKREDNPNPLQRKRIEMIARDLLSYHKLNDRFELFFSNLEENKLGLTQCKVFGEGIITGKITISRYHAENDNEDDVVETILHEISHAITPGAGHGKIWRETSKSIGGDGQQFAWCSGSEEIKDEIQVSKNLITLSGTPIKNHAGEFFPVLNLLKPELFPSHDLFLRQHTQSYFNGPYRKTGGLKDPERFKELTKDFTIRHTRKEVLPDLPNVVRDFQIRILQEKAQEEYLGTLEEYKKFYDTHNDWSDSESRANILAYMNRLRHITGLSKTKDGIEFVIDFLNDCDRKLVVFHHHKDVGLILSNGLKEICKELNLLQPVNISEEGLDDSTRFERVENFTSDPRARILIASSLKSGEGLNLQVCSDCLIVERQWNSANEEQAEGRFTRIGSEASHVNAVYLIGAGTIDELFTEIVERKRALVRDAMEGKEGQSFKDESVMKELSQVLASSGLKKFSLKLPEVKKDKELT